MPGGISVRDVDVSVSACSKALSSKLFVTTNPMHQKPTTRDFSEIALYLAIWPLQIRAHGDKRRGELTDILRYQAQKFINAYSAFLKRQGKLPIPGMLRTFYTPTQMSLYSILKESAINTTTTRLGRHRQNLPLQRITPSIDRLVITFPPRSLPISTYTHSTTHSLVYNMKNSNCSCRLLKLGFTPAPPPSPDTSTSARRSASAGCAKCTAAPRTAGRDRATMSMPAGASIAR